MAGEVKKRLNQVFSKQSRALDDVDGIMEDRSAASASSGMNRSVPTTIFGARKTSLLRGSRNNNGGNHLGANRNGTSLVSRHRRSGGFMNRKSSSSSKYNPVSVSSSSDSESISTSPSLKNEAAGHFDHEDEDDDEDEDDEEEDEAAAVEVDEARQQQQWFRLELRKLEQSNVEAMSALHEKLIELNAHLQEISMRDKIHRQLEGSSADWPANRTTERPAAGLGEFERRHVCRIEMQMQLGHRAAMKSIHDLNKLIVKNIVLQRTELEAVQEDAHDHHDPNDNHDHHNQDNSDKPTRQLKPANQTTKHNYFGIVSLLTSITLVMFCITMMIIILFLLQQQQLPQLPDDNRDLYGAFASFHKKAWRGWWTQVITFCERWVSRAKIQQL